ncbi:MAG: hypothetical protein EB153_09280 [Nitrosopumilaceae archaeon]|nr:hypothetical protein [Nitrosopumilaceae archaeon]
MTVKKLTSAPGPSEVQSWQAQIPKVGTDVSSSPNTNIVGVSPDAQYLYNLTNDQRKIWATSLRKAGYKVPTTGAFSESLLNAYLDALDKAEYQSTLVGKTFDPQVDMSAYLNQRFQEQADLESLGGEKITTSRQRQILRPETIENTVDEVFTDVLGRGATAAEKKMYLERIQKKMAQTKNMQTTRYVDVGGGVQEVVTQQGFSPSTYLYEDLAGTDEARQQKIFGFYDTFKRALGVQ